MANWRLATSLVVLRNQVNDLCPGRSKVSDGTVGDAAHATRVSDHNPDSAGVVAALDLTHDPTHGLDIGNLAERFRISRDARIKYVIANRRVFVPPNWNWQPYTGSTDPHTNHLHISVNKSNYDVGTPWVLTGGSMATQATVLEWYHTWLKREPAPDRLAYHVAHTPDELTWAKNFALPELWKNLTEAQKARDDLAARAADITTDRDAWKAKAEAAPPASSDNATLTYLKDKLDAHFK